MFETTSFSALCEGVDRICLALLVAVCESDLRGRGLRLGRGATSRACQRAGAVHVGREVHRSAATVEELEALAVDAVVLADLGVEKDLAFSRREGDLGEFVKSEGGEIVPDFELEAELGLCHA